MSADPTEPTRRQMLAADRPRADEQTDTGPRWTTDELQRDFEVIGFASPFVVARRRSDGAVGSLKFVHSPRIYFAWKPDSERSA